MTIPDNCKLISQNLTHNLRLAKTDAEQLEYLSLALGAFGELVISPLNELFEHRGEGNPELATARTAALELATFISGRLVRTSTHYRAEITSLEEVSDKCREPQLKSKLLFYTNQLKKRWLKIEPGGLEHNPRAKQIRSEVRNGTSVGNVLSIVLCLGIAIYGLVHFDLTALIFPSLNKPQQSVAVPQVLTRSQVEKIEPQVIGNAPQPSVRGAFYTFTDNQGVIHMVDDLAKVPLEYRKGMKVDSSASASAGSTPVIIKGNQVIVPVTITFRGRSVETLLLLDTGASVTTISESLAAQLGVGSADVKEGKTKVADGRSIGAYWFSADSLGIAAHLLSNAETSILPGSGGKGYEGLLGMNYLKNFRYHVNFTQSVIEWGG